ncbi:MAG: PilZ domain-containing protein [Rhodospirillales bacterium]
MSGRKFVGYKDDNRRRDVRLDVKGVKFVISNHEFSIGDMSVGGFSLKSAIGKMRPGQKFTITHVVTEDDGRVPLGAAAEVMRIDYAETSLGCRFGKLTGGQFRIVEAIAMRRPLSSLGGTVKRRGFFGLFGG